MDKNIKFLSLIEKYGFYINRVVKSNMRPEKENVKDVCQEVMLKIFISLDKLDHSRDTTKAWICTIALNECKNWYRKCKNYSTDISFDNLCNLYSHYNTINTGTKQQLINALNSLNSYDKNLFILKVYYGYTYKEISEKYITQMSETQLKNRFCYVRKNLKKFFSTF